jgi:hypothetical protein
MLEACEVTFGDGPDQVPNEVFHRFFVGCGYLRSRAPSCPARSRRFHAKRNFGRSPSSGGHQHFSRRRFAQTKT